MKDLLVIQLSRLGDLIQTLPLIKAYKDDMPECRVTLLCVREFAPVLGGARFIDRVVSIPFSRIKAALQADHEADIASLDAPLEIPELRETYDRVVNLTHTLGSAHICSRVPARARNGRIETYPGEIRVAGDWGKYLFCITKSRTLSLFNLVDVYMGLGGVSPRPVSDYLEVTRWQREQALQLLEANGYTGKGPLIGLHMGANRPHRTWGISNFARLAGEAVNEAHSEIVLIGGPGEADMGEQFLASAQVGAINLIGRTDLQILPGVLSHCDLLVTNDTGPAHIAAAVGTKVVGIFFSTAFFGETAPYGEGHIVLQAERECTPCRSDEVCQDVACREDIPVAAVSEAVKAKLSGSLDSLGGESEGLGIYLSRFCANGTLIYEPMSVSRQVPFQKALLTRMMWGAALGVENSQGPARSSSEGEASGGFLLSQARTWHEQIRALKGVYQKGAEAALGILETFSRHPIDQDKVMGLAQGIQSAEEWVGALDGGLEPLRSFHNHEIMDMDRVNYPELARLFAGKYARMIRVTDSFLGVLDRILQKEE